MGTTHVLMIVDMSGSMFGLAGDVRGGFNSFVNDLRKDTTANYRITTCLFDSEYDILCTAATLAEAPALTTSNYSPRGMTALLDAVGRTVLEFDSTTELAGEDKVLVVVQTDGLENYSREFGYEQIKKLVADKEKAGWNFIYLGAGSEAWDKGGMYGFSNSVNTTASAQGTRSAYAAASCATTEYARGASGLEVTSLMDTMINGGDEERGPNLSAGK